MSTSGATLTHRATRRASACLVPHSSNSSSKDDVSRAARRMSNGMVSTGTVYDAVDEEDSNMMLHAPSANGNEMEQIGLLCCKIVEATNFQVCPAMLRADQVHVRNMRELLQLNQMNSNMNSNANISRSSVESWSSVFSSDEDYALFQCAMQTECLLIVKVAQTNFYSSVHSLHHKIERQQQISGQERMTHTPVAGQGRNSNVNAGGAIKNASGGGLVVDNANGPDAMAPEESKYICIMRRSNVPLFSSRANDDEDNEGNDDILEQEDVFEAEQEQDIGNASLEEDQEEVKESKRKDKPKSQAEKKRLARKIVKSTKYNESISAPFIICMTFQDAMIMQFLMQDKPETHHLEQIIREQPFDCCLDLTDLLKIDRPNPNSSTIHLIFRTGEAIEVETLSPSELMSEAMMHHQGMSEVSTRRASMSAVSGRGGNTPANDGIAFAASQDLKLKTDRFLWAIIQLHALLISTDEDFSLTTGVELQPTKNIDFQHLHYLAAVNGFLANHNYIFALIERTYNKEVNGGAADSSFVASNIFSSQSEAKEAEDILNATNWFKLSTDGLINELHTRMRQLESNACRRLIAWEDEKNRTRAIGTGEIDNDSQSLLELYKTLDSLDQELLQMQRWLQERSQLMKPIMDDCFELEKENKALVEQWESFKKLGLELGNLLDDLQVPTKYTTVLLDPYVVRKGTEFTENDIDVITEAGRELKLRLDKIQNSGSIHLKAVYEKSKELLNLSHSFCDKLALIIKEMMFEIGSKNLAPLKSSADLSSHKEISRAIRDVQRKFHASLLIYIPLIEVLVYLKPKLLSMLREVYSNIIVDQLLNKDLMQEYFSSLNSMPTHNEALNLKDYPIGQANKRRDDFLSNKNAMTVKISLNEMLPIVVREAFFTSAFFRLAKNIDGRSKKTNFEIAKVAIDASSAQFRFQLARCCGLGSLQGKCDPMLPFTTSFLLNESMEGYFDKQKKGGDHSLSLAYIRSTILDLRKQVDKQWGAWIDEQIQWIHTNPGMSKDGKRVGVLPAFLRFPSYLDHLIHSCRTLGTDPNHLVKVKVVCHYLQKLANALFESLHTCADKVSENEGTSYVGHVLRMENSYFFFQTIQNRSELSILFQKHMTSANTLCKSNISSYISFLIKREFKGLYQIFSQISKIRRDVGDAKQVQARISKQSVVSILSSDAGRDNTRSKLIHMYERARKHMSRNSNLLPFAWKALVKDLYELFGRWEKLCMQCYSLSLEPNAVDIVRMAKEVGTEKDDGEDNVESMSLTKRRSGMRL